MTVGQTIRMLRKKRGWTQAELGERCGLSGVAVCAYERGRTLPKKQVIEKFAGALDVPASEITGEAAAPLLEEGNALYDGILGALKLLYQEVEGKMLLDGSGGCVRYYTVGQEPFVLREKDVAALAQSAKAAMLPMVEWMRLRQAEGRLQEKLG